MSFTIKRTGDGDYPKHLKVLVMGSPKSGKTTFVSTAPNVVVAALPDAGLMAVAHKNVPYVDIADISTLQTLLMVLSDETLRAKAAQQLGIPTIETVAIDTIDNLQEIQKMEILKANRASEMRQADWGKLKEYMAAILKGFVALPLNVIFTVHTATMQDDEQKIIHGPALQGSIKDEIAGWVDFSLLAERKRELDASGVPVIKYYLKAEGDQKNPHLGNRAAGRVPEYVEPDFKLLHDAVFAGMENILQTESISFDTAQSAVSQAAETVSAQQPSQPSAAVSIKTGVPQSKDDNEQPINAAGIKALTKMFTDLGVNLPDFTQPIWTLGFGRETAKMIQLAKADEAEGKGEAKDELLSWLDAWEIVGSPSEPTIQTPVETKKPPAKPRKKAEPKVPSGPAAAEEPEVTEDEAVANAVAGLGAVVIGEEVTPATKCAQCDKPVDDPDVAQLSIARYRRPLCVADYLSANAEAKS